MAAFCSTSRMVTPCWLIAMIGLEDLLHQDRRQAHGRLVQQQEPRAAPSARARSPASAARRPTACPPTCVAAPGRRGKSAKTRSRSPRDRRRRGGCRRPSEVLATVSRLKMRRPSGTWAMPRATIVVRAARRRATRALEAHVAPARAQQAGDRLQRRRLARAVGAEEGDDLALADRERDALEGADLAVADVRGRRPQASRHSPRSRPAPAPARDRPRSRAGRAGCRAGGPSAIFSP